MRFASDWFSQKNHHSNFDLGNSSNFDFRSVFSAHFFITHQGGAAREVVITGLGVVSPIGIGVEAFQASLRAGRSGVGPISLFDASGFPVRIGAEVRDFDPKAYVRPRKSLKVMAREIQFGFAAADMALAEAKFDSTRAEPDRFGVVFGAEMIYCELADLESAYRASLRGGDFEMSQWGETAMGEIYPLWLLKNLPNMVACHVAIANDARGPNNTIGHSDVGSLAAIMEAVRVIERDKADLMIAGGVGRELIRPPCRTAANKIFRTATKIRSTPRGPSMPAATDW